jgi:hypothetical protein
VRQFGQFLVAGHDAVHRRTLVLLWLFGQPLGGEIAQQVLQPVAWLTGRVHPPGRGQQ